MESKIMIRVAENRYGKSRVRLVQVKRHGAWHDLREWTVEVLLQGDFAACFVDADNSKILPTDTMKNTIYSLARTSGAECMEEFAKELIVFLLERNPQVSAAEVSIAEKSWDHLQCGGKPQPTTFIQASRENQTTRVTRTRAGEFSVNSGLENLVILKTSGSAFEGYIQDPLTTLAPAKDRLLGTAVSANWNYSRTGVAYRSLRPRVREILLAVFAGHDSK